jgi:RNA polymerase sigma-70 factor (ECF subfamily)
MNRVFAAMKGGMEDAILIWRLKCGNTDALCRIYEKYESDMLAVATNLLGDRYTAQDIVHDVFVAFAGSIHKLSIYGNLRSYLTTCAVNRCRDWRRSPRQTSTSIPPDYPAANTDSDPANRIIADETAFRLAAAMAELPYDQREVILLHIRGEMRFKAIADHLKVSINTVQSRYRYGLQKLRSLLDGEVER